MVDYKALALELDVEEAALRAVVEVESMGKGYMADGRPKILFEPHVFWSQLKKQGKNPHDYLDGNSDILRPRWERNYGSQISQWPKMERAKAIDLEAALNSASYGAFQVMGFNHKVCGFKTVFDFVEAMHTQEGQVKAFVGYIKSRKLIDELQRHDWEGFAYGYNGAGYAQNRYDEKIEQAYKKYAGG